MLKSAKTNTLASGLIDRTSSMQDDVESKTVHKDMKKVVDKGKGSKTLMK